ncbi:hypothetical protein DXT99_26440 [Pontibacter diazotrophicus]|uniref:Uncharacterized protein n=1 Tax=Pontibacter diazotrophicus TaxID=1400979 RepID=A0A3D8KYU2_9BACT|nr:hypothetical protein [Pontibacter diazotrophicus]RDV10378.1 hypothetical protein DXT99_26440 [Pontibacter diazotrophicus]
MISTHAQYYAVASRIEQIKDAPAGSEAAKELKVLMSLIVSFESEKQQTAWANPAEQFKAKFYRM